MIDNTIGDQDNVDKVAGEAIRIGGQIEGTIVTGDHNVVINQFSTSIKKPSTIIDLEQVFQIQIREYFGPLPDRVMGYMVDQNQDVVALSLSGANLSTFPQQILQIATLRKLSLAVNNLHSIPADIQNLRDLSELNLSQNEIKKLPDEIGSLDRLNSLDLSQNAITHLPPDIAKLQSLESLILDGNPINQPPPEIVAQGLAAIKEYLRQIPIESKEVNEAKLILVGQGEAGKTTLVHRLVYGVFKETNRTRGIAISHWGSTSPSEGKNITLRIWDFGGQEIYRSTHQFFLTKRSIYLLVWNARKSRDYDQIYQWLYTVDAHSESSPVILVMTKADVMNDDLNLRDIKAQFPQVVGLVKVDSKSGYGISELKSLIRAEAWKLPHMQTTWISSWLRVRERLESDHRSRIGFDEFEKVCIEEGLGGNEIGILDEYLHDLGVTIHYRDSGAVLQNEVILNPRWATGAVYSILDEKSIIEQGGVLQHNALPSLLDQDIYLRSAYPLLLELMQRFEIAFELENRTSHLVPAHLPSNEPDYEWNYNDNLIFSYTYDFLPPGILPRFIANVHRYILKDEEGIPIAWGDGVIISWENTKAIVRVNRLEKTIQMRVVGRLKRELLAIIKFHLDKINASIKRLKIQKKIPCRCPQNCNYEFDYEKLLIAEEKGVFAVQCQESWEEVSIQLLLNGYHLDKTKMNKASPIFVDLHGGKLVAGDNYEMGDIHDAVGLAVGRKAAASVDKLKGN